MFGIKKFVKWLCCDCLDRHSYKQCVCDRCGKVEHDWDGCNCRSCFTTRHTMSGCCCTEPGCDYEKHDWATIQELSREITETTTGGTWLYNSELTEYAVTVQQRCQKEECEAEQETVVADSFFDYQYKDS